MPFTDDQREQMTIPAWERARGAIEAGEPERDGLVQSIPYAVDTGLYLGRGLPPAGHRAFRGFDNGAYYRVRPENPRHYTDYTGTGNTLNVREPYVLQLIMDSLRYWITEMHVDGFRFDLASALARERHEVERVAVDERRADPIDRVAGSGD